MNDRCRTSSREPRRPTWRRRRQRGLTLVEVVAGLALLSTLLVAVLTTKARVTRQWAHAQRTLQAVAAADRLLVEWWPKPDTFPRDSSGVVAGETSLRWRTTPVANQTLNALRTSVVRLEILDQRPATSDDDDVLASVDVVLDDELPRGDVAAAGDAP